MTAQLDIRKVLELAIKAEDLGARFYDGLAGRFEDDDELKGLFTVLARDEEAHQFQFQRLLKELPADQRIELPDGDQQYLEALAAEHILDPGGDVEVTASAVRNRDDGLQRAAELERSALLYYTAIRETLGSSEVLDAIIATEKAHLVRVMKYMVSGAEMRGLLEDY